MKTKNDGNVIYEGFFVKRNSENSELLKSTLDRDIIGKHITTEFRPEYTHEHLFGIDASFRVVGYGINSDNEGYLVDRIRCDNEELRDLFMKIQKPHITTSVSHFGKPVNTKDLYFKKLDEPFWIDAQFECYFKDRAVIPLRDA